MQRHLRGLDDLADVMISMWVGFQLCLIPPLMALYSSSCFTLYQFLSMYYCHVI